MTEREDGVAIVTLNRPEKRNAMSLAMWRDMATLFQDLARDASVRAAILTGAGGTFCAGADISEFPRVRRNAEEGAIYDVAVDSCSEAIMEFPKPTIAAISGFCVGGGCGLALACDFRVADRTAQVGIPAARLGIVYAVRDTRNLLNAVGLAQAKRILFSGERFGAEEALRIGFAQELVDGAALDGARAMAGRFARNAPLSMAGAKLTLRGLTGGDGAVDRTAIAAATQRALDSADYRNAVAAFAARREPVFEGR